MSKCHIFNIDNFLIEMEQKVWIIDKYNPNIPLMKIPIEDFNLIKRGVYKEDNNSIKFGSKIYYIPNELMEVLKEKVKKESISEFLGFSMREFIDEEIIKNKEFSFNLKPFNHIKSDDTVLFISSKLVKEKYNSIVESAISILHKQGVNVSRVTYLNNTFFSQDKDENIIKISNIILENIIGYNIKNKNNSLKSENDISFDEVIYYDANKTIIYSLQNQLNDWLNFLIKDKFLNTDIDTELKLIHITTNKLKPLIYYPISLTINNLIKKFESFNLIYKKKFLKDEKY